MKPSKPGPNSPRSDKPKPKVTRWGYIAAGWLCVGLGVLGIPLPLLPTTPFLLLAAFCFARGSSELHDWLLNHPQLGPPILNWQTQGAVSRRAKRMATLSLIALVAISFALGVPRWIIGVQCLVLVGVGSFLWTRPEPV